MTACISVCTKFCKSDSRAKKNRPESRDKTDSKLAEEGRTFLNVSLFSGPIFLKPCSYNMI